MKGQCSSWVAELSFFGLARTSFGIPSSSVGLCRGWNGLSQGSCAVCRFKNALRGTVSHMETLQTIEKRRAIKAFDPEHKMSPEDERKLLETAMLSPTSFNIQHWRFVVVKDPAMRAEIRKTHGNDQSQMTDASLLVIMTADTKAWQKSPSVTGVGPQGGLGSACRMDGALPRRP